MDVGLHCLATCLPRGKVTVSSRVEKAVVVGLLKIVGLTHHYQSTEGPHVIAFHFLLAAAEL